MFLFPQKNKLAETYCQNGKPIYQEPVTLLGDEQVEGGEDEQTLIILSDSSDKAPLHAPVISPLQAWSEKVNSMYGQLKRKHNTNYLWTSIMIVIDVRPMKKKSIPTQ